MLNDMIAAIATPPGEGGIAIIRLSGEGVIKLVKEIFIPFQMGVDLEKKAGYTITLGWIIDDGQERIDEVLVSLMRAPHSYTGEDVIEINCHGGGLPSRRCMEVLLNKGVRLAEPGEFTRRAFLNGRLDISQAEAVIDIIRARTDKGLQLAMQQLQGGISRYIKRLEDMLIRVNAQVEASMDFPDEVGDPDYKEVSAVLNEALGIIDRLLAAGARGEVYREGISIAICGKPNVGKSSLLNALVKKDRAIVSEIPGTTRDVIEDYINVRGIPVKLMDTAGIRETGDLVEQMGVKKSQQAIEEAQLTLLLLDVEAGLSEEDMAIYKKIVNKNPLILVNKEDLEEKNISSQQLEEFFKNATIIRGSVREDIGLDELEAAIETRVRSGPVNVDDLEMMINVRQKNSLLAARRHVEELLASLGKSSLDCLGVDLAGALAYLGEISGRSLQEEVMERIFHDFCIGK